MPETITEKAPVIPDGKTEVSCLLEMMVSTNNEKHGRETADTFPKLA